MTKNDRPGVQTIAPESPEVLEVFFVRLQHYHRNKGQKGTFSGIGLCHFLSPLCKPGLGRFCLRSAQSPRRHSKEALDFLPHMTFLNYQRGGNIPPALVYRVQVNPETHLTTTHVQLLLWPDVSFKKCTPATLSAWLHPP